MTVMINNPQAVERIKKAVKDAGGYPTDMSMTIQSDRSFPGEGMLFSNPEKAVVKVSGADIEKALADRRKPREKAVKKSGPMERRHLR